jgi:hypothetical protein
MDVTKCRALKSELAKQLEPRVASVERFFDGNAQLFLRNKRLPAELIKDWDVPDSRKAAEFKCL